MRTTSRRSSEKPTNSRAGPAPPTLYESLAFPGLGSGDTDARCGMSDGIAQLRVDAPEADTVQR